MGGVANRAVPTPVAPIKIETVSGRVAGAGLFGWSRSRNFHPAPAPTL